MTEQVKHTPGPWAVDAEGDVVVSDGTVAWVGSANALDAPYTANLPNARLIAAAPEMYEALKAILDGSGPYISRVTKIVGVDAVEKASAAIAKAEGR
jgi:hypothetical protein